MKFFALLRKLGSGDLSFGNGFLFECENAFNCASCLCSSGESLACSSNAELSYYNQSNTSHCEQFDIIYSNRTYTFNALYTLYSKKFYGCPEMYQICGILDGCFKLGNLTTCKHSLATNQHLAWLLWRIGKPPN